MAQGWRKEYSRYQGFYLNILKFYQRAETKLYLELLLTLTAIAVFSVFALRPTIITIIDLTKEISTKEETLVKMNGKLEDLQTAQNLLSQEQKRLDLLDSAIPNQPLPDQFIRQVEGLSTSNEVYLENLSIEKVLLVGTEDIRVTNQEESVLPQGVSGYKIVLHLSSNFELLKKALLDLEKMRRPLIFSSLSLLRDTQEKDSNRLNLTLTGQVPYYKESIINPNQNEKE